MTGPTHPVAIDVGGKPYLCDAKGSLVPLEAVKATDLLMDEMVREVLNDARRVSSSIAAFKAQTFENVGGLQALLAQNYETTLGGAKGNITLMTFDGREKVQVQVADRLEFGPELLSAKTLIDECLIGWTVGSRVEVQSLVNRVFQVDKEGQISKAGLFMLLHVAIADERWVRAMDAIRVVGSRQYVRFYQRETSDGQWRAVSIDIANA